MKKVLLELSDEQCRSIDEIAKSFKKSRSGVIRILCEMMIGLSGDIDITANDNKNLKTLHNFNKIISCIDSNIGILNIEHYYNERTGATCKAEGVKKFKFGGDKNVD